MPRRPSRQQIDRLSKKIDSGEELTAEERRLVSQTSGEPDLDDTPHSPPLPNVKALAEALGVSRDTIYQWRQKYPADVPTSLHLELWQEFQARHSTKTGEAGEQADTAAYTKADWEIQKLRRVVRQMDLDFKKSEGELISRAEVANAIQAAAEVTKAKLLKLESSFPAKAVGKGLDEIRAALRSDLDAVCLELHMQFKGVEG